MRSGPPERPKRLYGRRIGRPLKPSQRALLAECLPALRIELPEEDAPALEPAGFFEPGKRACWLEIGFGAGEHLAWQAERNPDVGFIGAEFFLNGIAQLLKRRREIGLENIRLHEGDARALLPRLAPGSIERAFVLFPDPWPKARHRERRLIDAATLEALVRLIRPDGELRLASDDPDYLVQMLRHARAHPKLRWTAGRAADWRERPGDWPETRYEAKAREAGRRPAFLRFERIA